ncbi:type II toxin-antitoxin system YhaV family toxin [Rhizobium panacihumi]|uniref:type II toxin-antitoxin system YhaV family toxin n=1 Tax=Rhizobium panacihumi TaxID=2008450 RepID=UPI003D7B73D1
MLVIHGWTILAHPLLLDQLEKLTAAVEELAQKKPDSYRNSASTKLLAALVTLIFDKIPRDPASTAYVQGNTLGTNRRYWFRTKFGAGRFRLFFRYSSSAKIIIFAWVNDENTLRTYGAKTDAYAVFRNMLESGNPPDDWPELLNAASGSAATKRFDEAFRKSAERDT